MKAEASMPSAFFLGPGRSDQGDRMDQWLDQFLHDLVVEKGLSKNTVRSLQP